MNEVRDTIRTLENIELLAMSGTIGNALTDIMARMHVTELRHMNLDHMSDALERAQKFIVECEEQTKG